MKYKQNEKKNKLKYLLWLKKSKIQCSDVSFSFPQ